MIRINGNGVWFSSIYRNEDYENYKGFVERTAEKVEIPEGTEAIGDYCFAWSPLTEVTIPASVSTIGYQAFYRCTSLQSVVFAPRAGVPTFGSLVFSGSSVTDIYVPWAEGEVAGAPWSASKATVHYNHK